jgi:hypothetical protein
MLPARDRPNPPSGIFFPLSGNNMPLG